MMRFTVPGQPVPKQRARARKGAPGYYAPRAPGSKRLSYPEYKGWVQACFTEAVGPAWTGPDSQGWELAVKVYVKNTVGDIEGIAGAIADALEGLVWHDDRQIGCFKVERHRINKAEEPRVDVEIMSLGGTGFMPDDYAIQPRKGVSEKKVV